MQVSFNPVKYNYNTSFKSYNYTDKGREYIPDPPTKEEIAHAKTKKAISELKIVAIAVFILYFAMKRNLKYNKIKQVFKKNQERAKIVKPIPIIPNVGDLSSVKNTNINPMEFLGL